MEHAQGRVDGTNKSNVPKRHACAEILRIGMKHDEPMMQNAMPARCVNPPSCDRWPPGGKAIQTHPTESQTTPHPTSPPPRAYEIQIENRQPHFLLLEALVATLRPSLLSKPRDTTPYMFGEREKCKRQITYNFMCLSFGEIVA